MRRILLYVYRHIVHNSRGTRTYTYRRIFTAERRGCSSVPTRLYVYIVRSARKLETIITI